MSGVGSSSSTTVVEDDEVVFRLGDPDHDLPGVTVWIDLVRPAEWPDDDLAMRPVEGGWELRLALPDLDCLEYLFVVGDSMSSDPGNPDQVEGAFGAHSYLAMPGYRPPSWLDAEGPAGTRSRLTVREVDVEIWAPDDDGSVALPMLLVHDGAEMDRYGAVVHYAATRAAPMRVALLSPGDDRDERYAANPAYAATLVAEVMPALAAVYETAGRPVLLGQSLGGLAALHAAWHYPGAFAGLALQSGSYFTPVLDPQESGYAQFDQVVGFVASVHESTGAPLSFPPVAMTCGTAEENLANNRFMHTHLLDLGVEASWGEVRQGHTWTCWRDSLHPHLGTLLERVWE